jgi:hypothetical protein
MTLDKEDCNILYKEIESVETENLQNMSQVSDESGNYNNITEELIEKDEVEDEVLNHKEVNFIEEMTIDGH